MYQQVNPNEMPGVGSTTLNQNKAVWLGRAGVQYLPGGGTIDGSNSRDPSNVIASTVTIPPGVANSTYYGTLQAGVLMGKVTASGFYAPSVIGTAKAAYSTASNNTTLQMSAAVAAEVIRRCYNSASGAYEFYLIGPPTANSGSAANVATQAVSASAFNTTSGNATITALSANAVAGSFIAAKDGSQIPVSFIDEMDGIRVTDGAGNSVSTVQFPRIPIAGGVVNTSNLVNYPADSSLILWLKSKLGSNFVYSDNY